MYVALDDGYGTLHADEHHLRGGRNKDFRFARGELLLRNVRRHSTNGYRNVVVVNGRGQVGDVLGDLLMRVDERLGRRGE